jgi:NitT/TauT family transport system ATP-binding protein
MLRLIDVDKQYGSGTLALHGMSLAVADGEFVSVVGASGCGKSTALRLIAGLSPVSAGRIEWSDRAGAGTRARDHGIGFVFQEPTLMPWATVEHNVSLPLRIARLDNGVVAVRVADALAQVGLSKFAHAYPRELSGGMKMRVSIARALVTRPALLLMDEPFAALDEMTRNRLNDDLLALWGAQRLTVIFVTHSVYESVYLSNRVVVMAPRPGRVIGEVTVAAPYPRDESFRTAAAYGDACREVTRLLRVSVDARAVEH